MGDVTAGSWDAAIHGTGSSGNNNIAIGLTAGEDLAGTGNYNVFIGDNAGKNVTYSDENTFVGYNAGSTLVIGSANTGIGRSSLGLLGLLGVSGGDNNSMVGESSGYSITTGANNTGIGVSACTTLTTGDNNVCIGASTATSATTSANQIVIGTGISGADDRVCIGKSGNVLSADYTGEVGSVTWSATSDINIKKNIDPETIGLSLINKLNPVQFNFKGVDDLSDEEDLYVDYVSSKSSKRCHGFIAQEVEEAAQSVGIESLDGLYVDAKGVYQFGATVFVQPMVKAIQELSSKIDFLESRLAALE